MELARLPGLFLLIFGFGFVIFWHELGHFLAAKWAGVKVEQFAVGFGQALVSWRKGLGWTFGSSREKYEKLLDAKSEGVPTPDASAIGETEYRLNWIPLGGYVKMLGQDDMNPNSAETDPRAYNMKPIGKRMVIVSAGVIMNIILAIFGFTVLFGYGFRAPPAVVGGIIPGSPAQRAGMQVGDTILTFDGKTQYDFTKVMLSAILASEKTEVPVVVRHPDGTVATVKVTAERRASDSKSFLALGIIGPSSLLGLDPAKVEKDDLFNPTLLPASLDLIHPGDVITSIDGQPVKDPVTDYFQLDRAAQSSFGKPIQLRVKAPDGKTRDIETKPVLLQPFGDNPLSYLGMEPRATVDAILKDSVAVGQLKPGDAVLAIHVPATQDQKSNPSNVDLRKEFNDAGQAGEAVIVTVLRDGTTVSTAPMKPTRTVEGERLGLGISPGYDIDHAVIAGVVKGSPAELAGIAVDESSAGGASVVAIDDQPTTSWYDVDRLLKEHVKEKGTAPIKMVVNSGAGKKSFDIPLDADQVAGINSILYGVMLPLREQTYLRQTSHPTQAITWGFGETRDLIVQFYLTLKRMVQGSVPASGAMGPLGIVTAGAKFAYKGNDWLIWFLSMISANLAVVNFLPIPIVDGGLFTFLIIEKLQGRPLSARTQAVAQVVGLALIGSVFLFVTYQDILRML